jgi:hypothetical protein
MDEPEDVLELERRIAQASRISQQVPDPTPYERLKAWVEELRQRLRQRRAGARQVAGLLYTSGTTGAPKEMRCIICSCATSSMRPGLVSRHGRLSRGSSSSYSRPVPPIRRIDAALTGRRRFRPSV